MYITNCCRYKQWSHFFYFLVVWIHAALVICISAYAWDCTLCSSYQRCKIKWLSQSGSNIRGCHKKPWYRDLLHEIGHLLRFMYSDPIFLCLLSHMLTHRIRKVFFRHVYVGVTQLILSVLPFNTLSGIITEPKWGVKKVCVLNWNTFTSVCYHHLGSKV